MASIFTFETEPPRISSPWPERPPAGVKGGFIEGKPTLAGIDLPRTEILANCNINKLEAEPQEGSVEYKLHLLLRQRRSFYSTSTAQNVSGSHLSKSRAPRSHSETDVKRTLPSPVLTPTSQSRQNRLQHLTTQLLWRLQQSSPYHSTSKSCLVLPVLPESDLERSAPDRPGPLIPGLEGSSGALYEIGVSDDGTFVGLARDELEESLRVLRAMAFSLGCNIQVLRMVIVGDCQWTEIINSKAKPASRLRKEKLWVAEVLVVPSLNSQVAIPASATFRGNHVELSASNQIEAIDRDAFKSQSEQLRVSLTGSTTSGKSSLLGTLSTSTLDNGRGKSRLSLLKHRHEIVSGVTSSLAQELFGYLDSAPGKNNLCTKVINYASGNVSSWDDIHNSSESGRLIFVTDSAGHPRYRRTTLRGLVSWAPHWTLCCLAADDQDDSIGKVGATASASKVLGSAGVDADLSKAHLELCLKLGLPLVVVITKLDLATKSGLRDTLARTLTILKSAGRRPAVLSSLNDTTNHRLQSIARDDEELARGTIGSIQPDQIQSLVPIVLTSAVTGTGISKLHALLRQLPVITKDSSTKPSPYSLDEEHPQELFHIDEVFAMPANHDTSKMKLGTPSTILSGYVRYGSLSVGDNFLIGPCFSDEFENVEDSPDLQRARSYPGLIRGSPRAATLTHDLQGPTASDFLNKTKGSRKCLHAVPTWQEICITSLRNLRLPVRTLCANQVGTIGISLRHSNFLTSNSRTPNLSFRRGMVMLPIPQSKVHGFPPSYNRFSAVFQEPGLPAWPGVLVVVYTASIRTTAKIMEVRALETEFSSDEIFRFEDSDSDNGSASTSEILAVEQKTEITFELVSTREWLEIGTQIWVTPGGGPSLTGQLEQKEVGSAGLDGYAGMITHAAMC